VRTAFASSGASQSPHGIEPDRNSRIALFLDVDGTLLDLAERPDEVTVPPGLVADVAAAQANAGGALALVSGRAIEDLDRLFAPLRLPAAGVHGAELRFAPEDPPFTAPDTEALPPELWAALAELLRDFPGTFAENKRYSYAVHYRQAPRVEDALRTRLEGLLETSYLPEIMMLEAHCAFELKSRQFDKGRAVAAFLSRPPFQGRTPIFIGDDYTDEAGFAAVSASGGRAYSVGRRFPGVAAEFASPSDVRNWVAAFAAGGVSA
jgi:trehalose 6-phosphate phosphatase